MSLEEKPDAIAELAKAHGRTWKNINACAHAALEERARISGLVETRKLVPPDCSFLVLDFGAGVAGADVLDAYDKFLAILADNDKRERLRKLGVDDAFKDDIFIEARAIGTEFQSALTKLFFGSDPALTAETQRYGVF